MKNPNAKSRISSSKHWHEGNFYKQKLNIICIQYLNKIQSASLVDGNATWTFGKQMLLTSIVGAKKSNWKLKLALFVESAKS